MESNDPALEEVEVAQELGASSKEVLVEAVA